MAAGKVIGYIRVSTHDQSAEWRLEGILLDKTFVDQASGKDVHCSQLAALLDYVRDGDKVFVHSMDRLAHHTGMTIPVWLDDLRKIVQELTKLPKLYNNRLLKKISYMNTGFLLRFWGKAVLKGTPETYFCLFQTVY